MTDYPRYMGRVLCNTAEEAAAVEASWKPDAPIRPVSDEHRHEPSVKDKPARKPRAPKRG